MPGFNLGPPRGDAASNVIETRRKHRWTFTVLGSASGYQWSRNGLIYLKTASRPKAVIEKPELHHDEEMARFAGKYAWDPINLVWYDVEQDPDISGEVYSWLNSVVEINTANVDIPSNYKSDAKLNSTNGTGAPSETWTLYGSWPAEADFSDLDYTNTELQEVTVLLVYDRAARE